MKTNFSQLIVKSYKQILGKSTSISIKKLYWIWVSPFERCKWWTNIYFF